MRTEFASRCLVQDRGGGWSPWRGSKLRDSPRKHVCIAFTRFGVVGGEVLFSSFLFGINVGLRETCRTPRVKLPPGDRSFDTNLIGVGSSPPAAGKAAHFLFPARTDQETHSERLPVDIRCLIHEAFPALPSRTAPPWRIVLPSKKITK